MLQGDDHMKTIQRLAAGILVSAFALGCGAAVTPQLVQCKLEALNKLPADPMLVTPYDISDLIEQLNACGLESSGSSK